MAALDLVVQIQKTMNDSETSMPNEWNENPTKAAWSPEEYENSLKEWTEAAGDQLTPVLNQSRGGCLQDRASRLSMASEARSSRLIRV